MEIMNQMDINYEGFAQASEESLANLQKALTAGTGVDASAYTGGRAMTPESLEATLVNILHSQDDAVLFKKLKKEAIPSPVHQFNVRSEVGSDFGAWVAEGADANDTDQTIARVNVLAKYLQTRRTVTLQAAMSNMLENAIALEKNAGTLWLIRNVEKSFFKGNSSIVTEEPDGLDVLIPTSNVIDVRGADATGTSFINGMEEGARIIRDSFGRPTDVFFSNSVATDVQRSLRDRIRFGNEGNTEFGGTIFKKYPTTFGDIELDPDVFIKEGTTPSASSLVGAPSAPTLSTSHTTASGSLFATADGGDYVYKVVGVNKYGDGVASAEAVVTGVAAGEGVTILITQGATKATGFKVYRSKKGGSSGAEVRYAYSVAAAASNGVTTTVDINTDLPGTSSAYILTLDPMYDAIQFCQFLPMMKFDLYPTAAAVQPFLMLLFGALALKKSVQHVRIRNLSPSKLGWF